MDHSTTEQVYAFIQTYTEDHPGLSPSQREIAQACFLSQPAVIRHLDRLEQQGRIQREPGQARSIRIIEDKNEHKKLSNDNL